MPQGCGCNGGNNQPQQYRQARPVQQTYYQQQPQQYRQAIPVQQPYQQYQPNIPVQQSGLPPPPCSIM